MVTIWAPKLFLLLRVALFVIDMYIPKGYIGIELPKAMVEEMKKYGDPEQIVIEALKKQLKKFE